MLRVGLPPDNVAALTIETGDICGIILHRLLATWAIRPAQASRGDGLSTALLKVSAARVSYPPTVAPLTTLPSQAPKRRSRWNSGAEAPSLVWWHDDDCRPSSGE